MMSRDEGKSPSQGQVLDTDKDKQEIRTNVRTLGFFWFPFRTSRDKPVMTDVLMKCRSQGLRARWLAMTVTP